MNLRLSRPESHLRSIAAGIVLLPVLLAAGGCTHPSAGSGGSGSGSGSSSGSGGGGSSAPDPYANMTGNWQLQATPTSGTAPFTILSGYVSELAVNAPAHQTNAAFLVTSSGCFADTTTIPLSGNVQQPSVGLSSFNIEGQVLTLNLTKNEAATSLSGTYAVAGGCGDGETGTITGLKYAPLTGTYTGPLASDSTRTLTLNLSQYADGTGTGTFLVTGSASMKGFACFTSGSLGATGAGYVSGSTAVLTFNTNDPSGAQLALTGTFDTAAGTLTVNSIQVTAGSCSGSYGGASLVS